MNCPKCNNEMTIGYLQTDRIIAFNKQRHKFSLNPKDVDDVLIAKNLTSGNDFNGFICKECGLIVFDYKNLL